MSKEYKYKPIDVTEANLYNEYFPYEEIPKVAINNNIVPLNLPEEIWITDTTFRDGQQSMSSFTVRQILKLYDYLHEIDNNMGVIRQSEFFLYSSRDREAVRKCQERGYEFPQITSWIRADEKDFELVKKMEIKETGMLMSCSDYHIFKKLGLNRREAMEKYITVANKALDAGITPRCHLEDITRADFYGFVVPLVKNINELGKKANIQAKFRACDTLGLGLPYGGVELPRSVPAIISGLREECGIPSKALEWHGHNDYHNVVTNSTSAWLYGAASVNTTLLGVGERTGNSPLEAMLVEYTQLKGQKGIRLELIREVCEYFSREFDYTIDAKRPFVGSEFNMTKAGVHADGILKYEPIYNSFDTKKILNSPVVIKVNQSSGLAGITAWINSYYNLKGHNKINKRDLRVQSIKNWIDNEYESGRNTDITSNELVNLTNRYFSVELANLEMDQLDEVN